jgi:hypothetical protein
MSFFRRNAADPPPYTVDWTGPATAAQAASETAPTSGIPSSPVTMPLVPRLTSPSSPTRQMPVPEHVGWPNANTEAFPADVVAVLEQDPACPPLVVLKYQDEATSVCNLRVLHPTKVDVRNLEELIHEPEAVVKGISDRFSLLGTVVSSLLYRYRDVLSGSSKSCPCGLTTSGSRGNSS